MTHEFNSISVIGLGYIGLPTAAIIAKHGVPVIGVDINQSVVDIINTGAVHIMETNLDNMVHDVVNSGMLRAVNKPEVADAFIIAVPTPLADQNKPDMSLVQAAARSIARVLEPGNLVILESTVPVGTTEDVSEWLAEVRPDLSFPHQEGENSDIRVAYCPERILPGHIISELVKNDRVIGGITNNCSKRAGQLYNVFVKGDCVVTGVREAEMTKLAENAYRDLNIAFANELAGLCEGLDINPWKVRDLANRHPRVNILSAGPGVGGHCIAVDPWFIINSAPEEAKLMRMAREVNDRRPELIVAKVLEKASLLKAPVIACLGLSYKANIDDLRESPAVKIIHSLSAMKNASILVAEPYIKALPEILTHTGRVRLCHYENAIREADIIVLLVDHAIFCDLDFGIYGNKTVIDTLGITDRGNLN